MLLQLLLAVIRRSQIGEKVQQSLLTKSSSSVAGSKISEQFSDIHFHISHYCKTMFCTTNCMKPAVIDGAIAKHFSDIQFHKYIVKSCFVLPIAWSCYWWDFCKQFFRYGDEPSGGFSSPQLKNPIPKKIKPDSLLFESRWFCHYLYFLFDPIIKNLNRKYSFIKQKLLHIEMKTKTFKVLFSLG